MTQQIFPITMPKWGIEMQQGTVTQWHAAPGQQVQKGETLLDVETDKIVNSVEAPVSGLLRLILAQQGAVENVGALIAVFAEPSVSDAEIGAFVRGFKAPNTSFEPDGTSEAAAEPAAPPASEEGRISPIARRLAERLGIDINKVCGTGRNGRVSKEDVEAYAAQSGASQSGNPQSAEGLSAVGVAEPTREKMTSMRAAIAKRLLASAQEIPHYRLAADVDFTALIERRAVLNQPASPVSLNDMLVRATALALMAHRSLNAQLVGDEIVRFSHADISIAIATDSGLITPVVRRAEEKSPAVIGAEIRDFARRARANQLTREEISGGTFTISNLGMFGIDRFDAIINPPQVGILAIGAVADRVIAKNGEARIARMATLTLSADHRVIDGAIGARFLGALKACIEQPGEL